MKPRTLNLTADDHSHVYLAYDGEFLTIGLAGIQAGSGSTKAVLSKQEDIQAIRELLDTGEDGLPGRSTEQFVREEGGQEDPIADRLDRIIELLERESRTLGLIIEDDPISALDQVDFGIHDPMSSPATVEDDPFALESEDDSIARADAKAARQVFVYEARLAARGLSLQDAVEMAMALPVVTPFPRSTWPKSRVPVEQEGVAARPVTETELEDAARRFRAEAARKARKAGLLV